MHNLAQDLIVVPANAILGRFRIFALQKRVIYKPVLIQKEEFEVYANKEQIMEVFDAREDLCSKLSNLLKLKDRDVVNGQSIDQMTVQERQVGVTALIQKAEINSAFLPTNVKGKVKFEFRSLLNNLNSVLLAQYLQKNNNCLSKEDVVELYYETSLIDCLRTCRLMRNL